MRYFAKFGFIENSFKLVATFYPISVYIKFLYTFKFNYDSQMGARSKYEKIFFNFHMVATHLLFLFYMINCLRDVPCSCNKVTEVRKEKAAAALPNASVMSLPLMSRLSRRYLPNFQITILFRKRFEIIFSTSVRF